MYCSYFWRLGILRQRHWQIQRLVWAFFLAHRWSSFHCTLTWWRARELSDALFKRALIPFERAPSLWSNYLPNIPLSNTIALGDKISIYESRGDRHSDHSISTIDLLETVILKIYVSWASMVVQWLRIHLPMQGTWVQSLVWEQRSHEPCSNKGHVLQLLKPTYPGAHVLQQEKPLQWEACTPQLESSPHSL